MNPNHPDYVNWFRHSAPYINAHRGCTFVLYVVGEAFEHGHFSSLIHDINVLNSLGVQLVLVHGSRPQIDAAQQNIGRPSEFSHGLRITSQADMHLIASVVGQQAAMLDAQFSTGLIHSPMQGSRIRTVRGNFITAQPLGVHASVDYGHTGKVRRVDAQGIKQQLQQNNLVVLSCLGFSPTGEAFNLAADQVAAEVAQSLQADKLIILSKDKEITNARGDRVTELLCKTAKRLVQQHHKYQYSGGDAAVLSPPYPSHYPPTNTLASHLSVLIQSCEHGVKRGHLLSYQTDGALLQELFSRTGCGTLVVQDSYEQIRPATIDDVGGIIELIRPLEQEKVLVHRSRERLEAEIDCFHVIELDGAIIGCGALYLFEDGQAAELACFVMGAEYRGKKRGETMLTYLEKQAIALNIQQLFILTTATSHWFIEQGYNEQILDALPADKQSMYNYQRNSKVLGKTLLES